MIHEPKKIHHRPSPNRSARPVGMGPEIIVLHGTAGASDEGDLSWLCNPVSQVSYHYLIGRTGTITQLVQESRKAWHAGVSEYKGRKNVNNFSIGVAFSNRGPIGTPEPYTAEQYDSGAWLCSDIWRRRGIELAHITTHAAVSPGRKSDPWEHFEMGRFFKIIADYRYPPPPPLRLNLAA